MIHFQSLTKDDLVELLKPQSQVQKTASLSEVDFQKKSLKRAQYRAQQIFHWVYQRFVTDWDQMSDLSQELRIWLKSHLQIGSLAQKLQQRAQDGTLKFLWHLEDGKTIESVLIPSIVESVPASSLLGCTVPRRDAKHRLTACISSQVGCAMGCRFCLTGRQGLERNLQVHEIIGQVFALRKIAPVTNLVFMGMGEPLHNFENVVKACEILLDQDGFNFSKRKITISTSGLVPGIEKLGKRMDVSLAVSLNGTTNEQRSQVMPINQKWDLEALLTACRRYPLGRHRKITFEYVMLQGVNDSMDDLVRLEKITQTIPSKINLIPFNEHSGSPFKRSSDETVRQFQQYLLDHQVIATVRVSRGSDILAACGQLKSLSPIIGAG